MKEQTLSKEEFYRELANRFFHENSYFCHCIKNELDGVLHDIQTADKPEYMLLGNLIDHLVSTDDSAAQLERLNEAGAFQEFNDRLRLGITFLQETDLDSERTKIEIESLAHSLFNSILLTFQDKEAVRQVQNILDQRGREETQSGPALSAAQMDLAGAAEAGSELEIGLSDATLDIGPQGLDNESPRFGQIIDETFNFDDLLEPELPSEHLVAPSVGAQGDVAFPEAEALDFPEALAGQDEPAAVELTPIGESDKGQATCDLDVESDTQSANGQAQKDSETNETSTARDSTEGIAELSQDAPAPESYQPDIVIRYFLEETRDQLNALDEVLQTLQRHPDSAEAWKKGDAILDSLVMTAVIYGFEAFEQIAGKARKLIAEVLSGGNSENGRAVVMLIKSKQMLFRLMSGDPEAVDRSLVKDFTSRLQTPKLTSKQKPGKADELEEAPGAFDERDSSTAGTADQAAPLKQPPLKLPGEDDQEVMNLIAEISGEDEPASAPSNGTVDGNQDNIDRDEFSDAGVHNSPHSQTVKHSSTMSNYHLGAELYYSVLSEALDTLETHNGSKTALDDLELAANALYGLALRLNVEQVSRLPDLILNLTKNVVATNYYFEKSELKRVKQAFQFFRNLKDVDDVEDPCFEQLLASLTELSAEIKLGATSPGG